MVKQELNTFEECRPHLFSVCKRMKSNQFDTWDLINEVWLMGRIQRVPKNCIKRRIEWDIIDFWRRQTGRLRYKSYEKRFQIRYPVTLNSCIKSDSKDEMIETFGRLCNEQKRIEDEEAFDYIINHSSLSRKQKIIINLKYIENYRDVEIIKVLGVSASRISQLHSHALQLIKVKILNETAKEKIVGTLIPTPKV